MRKKRMVTTTQPDLSWLPIDSRLIPSIFSFGRVTGMARIFLTIEMVFASAVVVGTLILLVLEALGSVIL